MMKHVIVSVIAALFVGSAWAESSEANMSLAKKLIALLHVQDSFQSVQASCGAALPGTSLDPRHVYKQNPMAFKGISPSSHLWPEIEEAYRLYMAEYCHSQDLDGFLDLMADVYASKMSAEQLQSAIDFHGTPAGQAFALVNKDAAMAFQALQQERAAQIQRGMEANFHAWLNGTYQKFQNEQLEQCPAPDGKKKV
ncbi:MAG: DUF2059 domain-containing protein [Aquabacterium sp.]